MKYYRILFIAAVISFSFCMSAFGFDNSIKSNDLNGIYKSAYQNCLEKESPEIKDEFSAYSYIINHKGISYVDNCKIYVDYSKVECKDSELNILKEFVEKVNNSVDLGALIVNPDFVFSVADAPEGIISFRANTMDLMPECRAHAAELKKVFDNAVIATKHVVAGVYFAQRVKNGGIWDYKRYLGLNNKYYETELKATMTGETVGNFHYGYVGSVAFSPGVLKGAAGLVQITSGTAKKEWFSSYFDDPKDQRDIQWGIDVYNRRK